MLKNGDEAFLSLGPLTLASPWTKYSQLAVCNAQLMAMQLLTGGWCRRTDGPFPLHRPISIQVVMTLAHTLTLISIGTTVVK